MGHGSAGDRGLLGRGRVARSAAAACEGSFAADVSRQGSPHLPPALGVRTTHIFPKVRYM